MSNTRQHPSQASQNLDQSKVLQIQKSLETKLRWLEDMQQMDQSLSPGVSNEEEMMKTVMLSLMGNFGCSSSYLFVAERKGSSVRCVKRFGGSDETSAQLLEYLDRSTLIKERKNIAVVLKITEIDFNDSLARSQKHNITLAVIIPVEKNYFGIILLGERLSKEEFSQGELSLITIMSSNITSAIRNYRLTNRSFQMQAEIFRTRGLLEQFVAPEIVDEMLNSEKHFNTKGERKLLTILSADIRGFTAISEKNEPEKLVSTLNRFYTVISDIISDHNGMVDKFIGDAVLAIFRVDPEFDPFNAMAASRDIHKEFEHLIKTDNEFSSVFVDSGLGIGLSTGEVVVGNFGSGKRMDYTVIGRSVNLSARLCSLARANETLIDVPTYEKTRMQYQYEELNPLSVKGIGEFVQVYKLI